MDTLFLHRIKNISTFMVAGTFISLLTANAVTADTTVVKLKDGKEYKIETDRGMPTPFQNEHIRVHDLGISVSITLDNLDAPPFVRVLKAVLHTEGDYTVTVTTPLDSKASARLEAKGPGRIMLNFFPQADYPLVWEGIDQPGVHWFPFHFVFEDKQSDNRFEFTQWAQMDYKTWKPASDRIKKDIEQLRKTQQKNK